MIPCSSFLWPTAARVLLLETKIKCWKNSIVVRGLAPVESASVFPLRANSSKHTVVKLSRKVEKTAERVFPCGCHCKKRCDCRMKRTILWWRAYRLQNEAGRPSHR